MFHIVFVCSGNQCRSPAAEAFLRARTIGLPVEVTSAGTMDIADRAGPPEMVAAVGSLGATMAEHRSRGFGSVDLARADLVIGFERHHVATAVVDGGAEPARTFLLRELVRLLREVPATERDDEDRARRAVAAAHALRKAGPAFVQGEELDDPIGRGRKVYEASARDIDALCTELAESLFGVRPG
jgi:protein-tyrosine phosphatase